MIAPHQFEVKNSETELAHGSSSGVGPELLVRSLAVVRLVDQLKNRCSRHLTISTAIRKPEPATIYCGIEDDAVPSRTLTCKKLSDLIIR